MAAGHFLILLFLSLLQFPAPSVSYPLCTDSRAPFKPTTPLAFCPYNGTSCCDSAQDLTLQRQFEAMNISASASGCASLVKSIICARCDPFSADLFQVNSAPRTVPLLCNSNSSQARNDYCAQVWSTCQNVSVVNSPFSAPLQGQARPLLNSTSTKLTDIWQSRTDFCTAFGGDNSVCFDGQSVLVNTTETPNTPTPTPSGMCLEKIGNDSYLNMVPLPDGSNRAFFSNQRGQIWLATIPDQGSKGRLELDESTPFLDLTDQVHFDTEFGLMGIAVHPNFAQNGRFFASFNCDKSEWPGCGGRCACNSDVNCDPSKLPPDNGAQPCQYQSVIAEYSTNGSAPASASRTSVPVSARPVEVRRIFTMGLPFTSHHGGQILFGPTDGYLYFMMGDGGSPGDSYNFAQNKKSLLGKIMRLDIDHIPSDADVSRLGLWGNYSIPRDNPFAQDKDLLPEIWATGFRNPWRCSFDSARPSYFMCADVGQDVYEEVDLITKDGNYGWSIYEGNNLFTPKQSSGGNTSLNISRPIFPVMGYNHTDINKNEGSASITGGYFARSMTDPCLYGSYLYGDLYASAIWAGIETPENSGNFKSSQIPFSCARDSPIECNSVPGSPLPALGYVFSFGEDNKKDIFLLASSGVYRVVRPSRCSYACTRENVSDIGTSGPASSPPSSSATLMLRSSGEFKSVVRLVLSCLSLLLLGSL